MRPAVDIRVTGPAGHLNDLSLPATRALWLGREDSCDVVLPSEMVSRKHATISIEGGELVIEDRSSNGTWVDGRALRRTSGRCNGGATLEVGPFRLDLALQAVDLAPAPGREDVDARRRLRKRLLEVIDLPRLDVEQRARPELEATVKTALNRLCDEARIEKGPAREGLISDLCDEALGLGPLQGLLDDPEVTEIMVVDPGCIYAERAGQLRREGLAFTDADAVRAVLERIVTPLGRRIDESSPLVDARLADGSRVNAIIPPLAARGPCITIRKFGKQAWDLTRLQSAGAMDANMARFLEMAVTCRKNIIIAGGTGSGKTTLLNALSAAIPERERVVTIEDAAELQLAQEHVVTLEARPPNMEGKGAFSIRDLLKNALRMRPDRIVVGECRGGEAIDMLQAMNTGHEGSMTTTHANSPRETVARLETLVLMAGIELPTRAIRQQIAASLHLIVQQARLSDGQRLLTHITEVGGLDEQGDIVLHDIFVFDRTGQEPGGKVRGEFTATGHLPDCLSDFIKHGLASEEGVW